MIRFNRTAMALAVSVFFSGAAHAAPISLEEIEGMQKSTANAGADSKVSVMRQDTLRDVALSIGAQGGLAWRSSEILASINKDAARLDAIYRFGQLVTQSGVFPPVIVEAQDSVSVEDDQLRVADRIYRIVEKARFASTPPSWRNYLFSGLSAEAAQPAPHSSLLPRNDQERAIWKQYARQGWQEGVRQADMIFEKNLARLDRDYTGMLRYYVLLKKGMVDEPKVAHSYAVVTGDANQIVVGDTLHQVSKQPGFKIDPSQWKPFIREDAGE